MFHCLSLQEHFLDVGLLAKLFSSCYLVVWVTGSYTETNMTKIFVFGSNLAGRHGKGAALFARQEHGAIYGRGVGPQGNSYAIPTKDENLKPLSLDLIKFHVDVFLSYAKQCPEQTLHLTPIGCGLAGYKPEQIAPMFIGYSENILIPNEFKPYLKEETCPQSSII